MPCPSETRLQAFVDGALDASALEEVLGHLDGCEECQSVVGASQPVAAEGEDGVDRIGRYVIRGVLGRGGMGVVYEAVDPDLHRTVALKVLRAELGDVHHRLWAEAEAMAQLEHPNVVRIYDVGQDSGRVFLVMELVHGRSLRHWLHLQPSSGRARRRSVASILDAYRQAGRGLARAHEVGLVHRDFKPDNVFVSDDGRILVSDFGLSAQQGATVAGGEGTRDYMAPEQREGGHVDARVDQYAFAVALEEALEAPPRWLRPLLAKARDPDPAKRFATMSDLLEAIERASAVARRWRRGGALTLGLGLLTAGGVAIAAWNAERRQDLAEELCREGEGLASAQLDAERRAQIEQRFAAIDSPLANTSARVVQTLADYTDQWKRQQMRSCRQAAHEEITRAELTARIACLRGRLHMVGALAQSFEHADAAMLEKVDAMLQLLPRLDVCDDPRATAYRPPPAAAEDRPTLEQAKQRTSLAAASLAAGRYEEGLAHAQAAWALASRSRSLDAHAEASLWLGTAQGRLGRVEQADLELTRAAHAAGAGNAPTLAIHAWIAWLHFVGVEGDRYEEGHRYADYAQAALEQHPEAYELEIERLTWLRALLVAERRYAEALEISQREIAQVALHFGAGHRLAAVAQDGMAGILAGQCRARDALAPQRQACDILEHELGGEHPQLALCLGNLATLHAQLGEHEPALDLKQRALTLFAKLPGHPHHEAMARRNKIRSLLELGRDAEVDAELPHLSERDAEKIGTWLVRGEAYRRMNRLQEALADHSRLVEETRDRAPAQRLEPLLALAETYLALGRGESAVAIATQAEAIANLVYDAHSCKRGRPSLVYAEALLTRSNAEDSTRAPRDAAGSLLAPVLDSTRAPRDAAGSLLAEAPARAALTVMQDAQIDPLLVARAQFALARAVPGDERQRLLDEAQRTARATPRGRELAAQLHSWLERNASAKH